MAKENLTSHNGINFYPEEFMEVCKSRKEMKMEFMNKMSLKNVCINK